MGIHMRPNFDSHTITRCKYLLQIAYDLEEEGIDPEAIMRMAVFISVVFAYNAGIDPEEYVSIIKRYLVTYVYVFGRRPNRRHDRRNKMPGLLRIP